MAVKKYITSSDAPLQTSMHEIREELAKLGVSGMDVDIRYDVNSGAAIIKFKWQGKAFERRSTSQPNAQKNMRVICLNLKHKVLDHLRGVEPFGDSMYRYMQIEGAPGDAPRAPPDGGSANLEAYSTLGINPFATWEQCERAYRQKAQMFHPDRFHNNAEMLKAANDEMAKLNAAWDQIKKERGK